MTLCLTGWFETEEKSENFVDDCYGESLNEIVCTMQERYPDFGKSGYNLEVELHFPNGDVKLVEDTVKRIVSSR